MNPLLLLLLGLGGFMGAFAGGGTGTSSQAATGGNPGPNPNPGSGADPGPGTPPADGGTDGGPITITLAVYDGREGALVREIAPGESVDFGSADVSRFTVGAEIGGLGFRSVVFETGGQTVMQNLAPYNMPAPAIDLTGGSYTVKVTVYSGANGTGTALATRTISFETAADEAPVTGDEGSGGDDIPPPAPAPEPPSVIDGTPTPPAQSGDGGSGAQTVPLEIDGRVTVISGRVHKLEAPDDATGVRIVSNLEHGNVTVNPDNTFAVVLTKTDFIGNQSFSYEITRADGSTSVERVDLNLVEGPQEQGWSTGETHYMLATDENDRVIVEAGENHAKVFISGSNDALSRADIARIEGIDPSQITTQFLVQNGYGATEDLALDEDIGMSLWRDLTPRGSVTSNHLYLERGFEYDLGRVLIRDTHGEDPLHPLYIGAYGDGARPKMMNEFLQNAEGSTNVVVQGIDFQDGLKFQGDGANILIDDINVTGNEMVLMWLDGVTVRNSMIADIHLEEPAGTNWSGLDKIQGMFGNFNNGLLIENVVFDLNGWEQGYSIDGDGDYPQAPSKFNHNLYLGVDNTDVTVRDMINMRGSLVGMQLRSGGFVEDVVFTGNNIGMNTLGGDYMDAGPVGEYSLLTDILVTDPGYRPSYNTGGRPTGIEDRGELSSLIDTIVAHLANPDDPQEQAERTITSNAVEQPHTPYYDDTIIWNWKGSAPTDRVTEQNAEGLDPDVLNQTTIQNFIKALLGPNATMDDFGDFLRAQFASGDSTIDADAILRYFQEGFGIAPDIRTEAETLRFVPSDLGEGMRWDNRLNWTTEDLPGTIAGDSVDLGGNHVVFGMNAAIDTLAFGHSGELSVYGGRLTVTGGIVGDDAASLEIRHAGQFWTDGSENGALDIDIEGGRFVNTGAMVGADLTATGGQTILATGGAIYGVSEGDALSVVGDVAIGFDDDDGGIGLLAFDEGSTLSFTARDGRLGTIEEFRTGAFGDAPDIRSGADLGNAVLEFDLTDLSAANGAELMLLDTDELIGAFEEANIVSLGARNATIVIDYVNDSVSLKLTSGNGQVVFQTIGEESDASDMELWNTLTQGQGVFDETAVLEDIEDDIPDAA